MTEQQAIDYLLERGEPYGLSLQDLKNMAPACVSDCMVELAEFYQQSDISHQYPQSTHPHLADEPWNMFPEDPDINRQRGAAVVTEAERVVAAHDREILARQIDADITIDGRIDGPCPQPSDLIPDWVPVFGLA